MGTRFIGRLILLAAAMALVLPGLVLAVHHTCDCEYNSETMTCSVSRSCGTEGYATCNCGNGGCTSSCSSNPPSPNLRSFESAATWAPTEHFDIVTLDNATLEGVKWHLEEVGWKVVVTASSTDRISGEFEDITIDKFVEEVSKEVEVCGVVNHARGMVQFLPAKVCGR